MKSELFPTREDFAVGLRKITRRKPNFYGIAFLIWKMVKRTEHGEQRHEDIERPTSEAEQDKAAT